MFYTTHRYELDSLQLLSFYFWVSQNHALRPKMHLMQYAFPLFLSSEVFCAFHSIVGHDKFEKKRKNRQHLPYKTKIGEIYYANVKTSYFLRIYAV